MNNFQDDSCFGNYYYQFSESPNYHLLDILSSDKNPFLDQQIYDSDDSIHNSSLQQSKSQETQNNSLPTDHYSQDSSLEQIVSKKSIPNKKTKIIQKVNASNKKNEPKSSKKTVKIKEKQKGNTSKYNNMGGFLIGSFAYILNNRFAYRFTQESYQIQIDGNWTQIEKINIMNGQNYIDGMRKLKKQIDSLPRRDGSKQDLFKLINDQQKDFPFRKELKQMIRKELVMNMQQQQWLREHSNSRDFKPNNDLDGSKKKERHEAYFSYLSAIKEALIQKGQLPKRLSL